MMTPDNHRRDYPLFIPDVPFVEKPREEWTKEEARAYFRWMMAAMDARVHDLLDYLSCPHDLHEELLLEVGQKARHLLVTDARFTEQTPEGQGLSPQGMALAADIGLLFAKLLCAACPQLHWEIQAKPKSDISYNLPVLKGFSQIASMDPLRVSIVIALGNVDNSRTESDWLKVFHRWKASC